MGTLFHVVRVATLAVTLAGMLAGCGFSTGSPTPVPSAPPTPVPQGPMSVRVLSVIAPRPISRKNQAITVQVRVKGIALDPLQIGRKPVKRHGHMQLYLDHIPSSAYSTGDLTKVVAVAAGPTFTFVLAPHWVKAGKGRHRYLIALAQNNDVLYRGVKPARFSLTVR